MPPVVVDDSARTRSGADVLVHVLANDVVPSGSTLQVASAPAAGTASVEGTAIRYRPDPYREGEDVFTYAVLAPGALGATASVRVTVLPALELVAVDDQATAVLGRDQVVDVPVLDNDLAPDGSSVRLVGSPVGGAARLDDADHVLVEPDPGTAEPAVTLEYELVSQDGTLVDRARVVVHLERATDPPSLVAVDDTVVATAGVSMVYDPTGNDRLGVPAVVDVVAGDCSQTDGDHQVLLTPGADDAGRVLHCTYELDPQVELNRVAPGDATEPRRAVITVLVQGADAVDDEATADAGGTSIVVDVLANDTGVPADAYIEVPDLRTPLGGIVSVDRGEVRYTPPGQGSGTDVFRYELRSEVLLDTAAVRVEVRDLPDAPATLTAEPGEGRVTLRWTPPDDDGGSAVRWYELTVLPDPPVLNIAAAASPVVVPADGPLEHTWTDLENETRYRFAVTAVNDVGRGTPRVVSATPYAPPAAPSVDVTPGDRALHVRWTPPAGEVRDVRAYEVTWAPTTGAGSGGRVVVPGSTTSFDLTGLENGREVRVSVSANNGQTGPAAVAVGTPRTVPGAPGALVCPPVDGTPRCTWSPPADDGGAPVVGYVVSWERADGLADADAGTVLLDAATLAVDLPGLVRGAGYTVQVAARNAAGDGAAATASLVVRDVTLVDDSAATGPDTPVVVDVTGNDAGVDPDLVLDVLPTATGTAGVTGGGVRVDPDDAAGPVDVTYRVLADGTELDRALLRVHVVDAVDDTATTPVGTTVLVPVLGNDRVDGDPGAALPAGVTIRLEAAPASGTAVVAPGGVAVTPQSASGTAVTYELVHGDVVLDRAVVSVSATTVPDVPPDGPAPAGGPVPAGGSPGVGDPPQPPGRTAGRPALRPTVVPVRQDGQQAEVSVAAVPLGVDDVAGTAAGVAVTVPVLSNDVAVPGLPFVASSVRVTRGPQVGTTDVRADGTVTYEPAPEARSVTDRFDYEARDAAGGVVRASVAVRVGPVTEAGASVPAPGGLVTLRGDGCVPGEAVNVSVGTGEARVVARADDVGAFAVDVAAPQEVGRHRVVARCGDASFATDVDVVLSTSATSAVAPAGAGLVVAGLLGFYLLSGSLLAPRGTSVPGRRLEVG